MENKKWRPFRRGRTSKKADNVGADQGSGAPNTHVKGEASQKRNGGLFGRTRKKNVQSASSKSASSLKTKPSGPVKIPSRSFKIEANLKRELKLFEELKKVEKSKDEHSTATHKDSVSSAQESVTGDFVDNDPATSTTNPASNEDNVAHDGLTRDIVDEFAQLNNMEAFIPEISDEIVSQAPTRKASSPGLKDKSTRDEEGQEAVQEGGWDVGDEPSGSASESPVMPNEVVLSRGNSDLGELTLFSEGSDDRALGITTPPALKRNEPVDPEVIKMTGTFETLRSLELVKKEKTPVSEREKRRMELNTLKQHLEEEKRKIQVRLAKEDTTTADLAIMRNSVNNKMEATSLPIHPNESEANPDDEVEADTIESAMMESASQEVEASELQDITLLVSAPETTDLAAEQPSVLKSSTRATESLVRPTAPLKQRSGLRPAPPAPFVEAKSSPVRVDVEFNDTEEEITTAFEAPLDTQRGFEEPVEDGIEEVLEAALLKRTTSDGSMGLDKSAKRSDSRGSAGITGSLEAEKTKSEVSYDRPSRVATSRIEMSNSCEEGTKVSVSDEQEKKIGRKKFRKERNESTMGAVVGEAAREKERAEKEHKVRLVENDFSSKCEVEIEHLPNEDPNEEGDDVNDVDNQSQGSVESKSWASRRSGSDADSYCSDPDPFSGIEEARLASLAVALRNARNSVAKVGETEALVNDTALTKRPSRMRFQRKAFFKRVKKGRDKEDPPGKVETSATKVTMKDKMAPLSKDGTTRVASAGITKKKVTKSLQSTHPPPPRPAKLKKPRVRVLSSESLSEISRGDSISNTVLHSNSFARNSSSKAAVAATDWDIEMNVGRASPNNILRNVSVLEETRPHIYDVSEEDESEEDVGSEGSSWEDDETLSVYSDGDLSVHGYSVEEFVHDYPVLMKVARTLSRTVTWGTGWGRRARRTPGTARHLSERAFASEAERQRRLDLNRSFSFSDGDKESDFILSDEGSVLSADILAVKGRFACM
eukprot:scaffold448_cov156-Amphora_coffeaeformis.AAC.7